MLFISSTDVLVREACVRGTRKAANVGLPPSMPRHCHVAALVRGAHGAFRCRDAHRHECDASDAFLDGAAQHAFIDDAAEAFGVAASVRGAIKREEKF